MIVFEPELWGVSPLTPDGRSPTKAPTGGTADGKAGTGSAPAKGSSGVKLWDGGSFDFHDILDVINPLQHLPVVSTIYRQESGDEIGAVPRILGSMLFGGGLIGALIGAASAVFNIALEQETGKDLGTHIYTAIFGEKGSKSRTTQVAARKSQKPQDPAASGAAAPQAAQSAMAAGAAQSAIAAKSSKAFRVTGPSSASNGRQIDPRTHAALQAFVKGLAKNSPAAAAAVANTATANSAARLKASAGIAPAKKGDVSTQFRRSQWYQQNQAALRAQAKALAATNPGKTAPKPKANAKTAGTTGTDGTAAVLQLFTNRGQASSKSPSASKSAAPNAKSTAAAAARSRAMPGPWVAGEISQGLAKYDAMIKARKATPSTVNQKH